MKLRSAIHLAICSVCLFLTVNAATSVAMDVDWEKLFSGEIEVSSVSHPDDIPGLQLLMTLNTSRERIWRALTDYKNFTNIFKSIDKLKVLKENPEGAHVEYWVDAVLANYQYVVYRHYEKPLERLTWERESGDLERIEGSWEIRDTPRPQTKLLIYTSYVQTSDGIPKSWVRWGAKRRARAMGKRLRQALEASASENGYSR